MTGNHRTTLGRCPEKTIAVRRATGLGQVRTTSNQLQLCVARPEKEASRGTLRGACRFLMHSLFLSFITGACWSNYNSSILIPSLLLLKHILFATFKVLKFLQLILVYLTSDSEE